MTTLNDIYPTDDVDDVLDTWVRELMGSTLRSEFKNVETLSATRVLLDADTPIQRFNCNGADRIAKMPTADAINNHPYLVVNSTSSGSWTLTVQDSAGIITLATLSPSGFVLLMPDGAGGYFVINRNVGGLTNSASSVTTSNVTGVAGTRHILDVSGMTANRNFVLPAGVAGQEIEVNISVGDDTYALILIGDTGISINGGSAATEWSRLFITNETVRFVATSSSNWNVINDGRIPCIAVLERQAAQSIANTTATKIAFDAAPTNRGNMGDIATNDRVNIRRSNFYVVSGFASIGAVLDNQEFLEAELYKNGSLFKFKRDYVATASSNLFSSPEAIARGTYSAGDYFELYIYHNEGASQNTDTTYYPTLAVIEQL